ncbi:MAG TPA: methyltransferase domain-containing protein [Terriglobales bacterium]|nr:methyltransferase domain-containing protein [Terriglobales bacterium]
MSSTAQQSRTAHGEIERLRQVYEDRIQSKHASRYSRANPGHLYALQEREATMAALFHSIGVDSLAGLRILDVGCGSGATLRQYLDYGASPEQLWGIDLLPVFAEKARSLNLQVTVGSASDLPFPDCSFDLISQFTLFTSVLDPGMKRQIAHEMDRALKPGGKLLWYDFAVDNPNNPNVRGVRLAEVRSLFPGYSITSRRITLVPPLGRMLGRLGPAVYLLVSRVRFLCTHYLCLLEKQQ